MIQAPPFNRHINRVFIDMDGVLANFDAYFERIFGMHPAKFEEMHGEEKFWAVIIDHVDFFKKLPLMPDALDLYNAVRHLSPIFLTGCSNHYFIESVAQKHFWTRAKFGPDQQVITCQSKNKRLFMKPGDVIVDDWDKYKQRWEENGGHWVLHRSANDSLRQLWELGVIDTVPYTKEAA